MRQLRKELVELLLSLIQLATADVVHTEQGHDAVDDEKAILIIYEILGNLVEEFHLMLGIDRTSVCDVLER